MERHLRSILRVVPGDTLRVGVVNGPRGAATVRHDQDKTIVLAVRWDDQTRRDESIPLTVLLGHPRPPVLTRLWRDLSAIGVARIVVFSAVLTERSYASSNVWKDTRRYLLEGLSQGAHTALPEVTVTRDLAEALTAVRSPYRFTAFAGERSESLPQIMRTVAEHPEPTTICVGPERGLVDSELQALTAAGFRFVGLGEHTLRTETAAILFAGSLATAIGTICSDTEIEL